MVLVPSGMYDEEPLLAGLTTATDEDIGQEEEDIGNIDEELVD